MNAYDIPDSKVHGANMGPIWGRQDPGGPHAGPMNFAIWDPNILCIYNYTCHDSDVVSLISVSKRGSRCLHLFAARPLPEPVLTFVLSIGPLRKSFRESRIEIQNFSFKKMHLKIPSVKWRPFCPGCDELIYDALSKVLTHFPLVPPICVTESGQHWFR